MSTLELNLHGGLGNQLFQFYYSHLISSSSSQIIINTWFLDKYKTKYLYELNVLFSTPLFANVTVHSGRPTSLLSRYRVVKLLSKLLRRDQRICLPRRVFLDSYYQDVSLFHDFTTSHLLSSLNKRRAALVHEPLLSPKSSTFLHIRLGDFFDSESSKLSFVHSTFSSSVSTSCIDVMTNDQTLVASYIAQHGLHEKYRLIDTSQQSPPTVLLNMMSYNKIFTNGSSLAMWSAILSASSLHTTSFVHHQFASLFPDVTSNCSSCIN